LFTSFAEAVKHRPRHLIKRVECDVTALNWTDQWTSSNHE